MTKKQKSNLHLTHDNKFFDLFVRNVKKFCSSKNTYVVVQENSPKLHQIHNDEVEVWNSKKLNNFLIKNGFLHFDSIYIHFLTPTLSRLVNRLPNEIPIVLVFWGAEIFELSMFQKHNIMEDTSKIITPIINNKNKFKIAFRPKNFVLECQSYLNKKFDIIQKKKALKRINYFAHYIREDYDLVVDTLKLNFEFIDFHYGGVYEVIQKAAIYQNVVKERKILVGNSGDYHNNHIDLFNILKKQKIDDFEIICPLSYSGINEYVQIVEKTGESTFGSKFNPITDFIPLEKYNKLMASCSIMIMGHIRSQAAANIQSALCFGVRVYMPRQSTLFRYLKRIGLIIHALDEMHEKPMNIDPLTEEEALWNCLKLSEHLGESVAKIQFQQCIDQN